MKNLRNNKHKFGNKLSFFILIPALLLLPMLSQSLSAQTKSILFKAPVAYPEGVAYDVASGKFLVSSVKTGTIGIVSTEGDYEPFYSDSSLKSTFGLKVDSRKKLLWACAGDPTYSSYSTPATHKKMIRLVAIDLATKKKVHDIDLSTLVGGLHFANDLVLDDKGNKYVTDSYSPVIYKVDAANKASVFAQNELFRGADIGLNGIVWHPSGFLIVANNNTGALLKVDIKNPSTVSRIAVNTFFPGADGLLIDGAGNLILIQNKGVNRVFRLASNDGWKTANVVAATKTTDRFAQPSTGTYQGQNLMVLNSKLNELSDPTAQPSQEFSIQRAEFADRP